MNNLKKINLGKVNHLYMNKSQKFKSIGLSVVYKMKYDYKNISAFNILAKYLGNCNSNYPSIELFNKYIESLYGATVGIKPSYVGSLFTVNFYINFLNPKYVNDDKLIEQAIALLSMLIYEPLMIDNHFDENIINICKETCLIDVESLKEYNMGYVLRKLKQELSNEKNSSMSSSFLGNEKVIKSLNHKNLVKYYNKLIHAPFDVYITGDYKLGRIKINTVSAPSVLQGTINLSSAKAIDIDNNEVSLSYQDIIVKINEPIVEIPKKPKLNEIKSEFEEKKLILKKRIL